VPPQTTIAPSKSRLIARYIMSGGCSKRPISKDRAGAIADLRQALQKSEPEYHKELREQINKALHQLLQP
jgi:hypothetical protein